MSDLSKADRVRRHFREHVLVGEKTCEKCTTELVLAAKAITASLLEGGTLFLCGNGGSASDSQHIAAELIGRFEKCREPMRAVDLTSDTSVLTCISNDYAYDEIFSRQISALGRKDDVLLALSTSGMSANVHKAVLRAKDQGLITVGFLGKGGGKLSKKVDYPCVVPSESTARIQEFHILMGHIVCDLIEDEII